MNLVGNQLCGFAALKNDEGRKPWDGAEIIFALCPRFPAALEARFQIAPAMAVAARFKATGGVGSYCAGLALSGSYPAAVTIL